MLQTEPCRVADAALEAVLPSGHPFPTREGMFCGVWGRNAGVRRSPGVLFASSTSSTGCESSFWTELLSCSPSTWHPVPRAWPSLCSPRKKSDSGFSDGETAAAAADGVTAAGVNLLLPLASALS